MRGCVVLRWMYAMHVVLCVMLRAIVCKCALWLFVLGVDVSFRDCCCFVLCCLAVMCVECGGWLCCIVVRCADVFCVCHMRIVLR